MLVVTVRFSVLPEHGKAFRLRVMRQAADSPAAEADCHQFDVAVDPGDASKVFLYEVYTDEAAFQAHLASPHFLSFQADTRGWHGAAVIERWTGPLR